MLLPDPGKSLAALLSQPFLCYNMLEFGNMNAKSEFYILIPC